MSLRDRLRRVEWPRALTLWGCADLFATGMGWAVTESHVLERVFWVTFPAVLIAFIVWMVALGTGTTDWERLLASRDHRIAELEREHSFDLQNLHELSIDPPLWPSGGRASHAELKRDRTYPSVDGLRPLGWPHDD